MMPNPRKLPDVLVQDVPDSGETVLVDRDRGKILALNTTGAAVWELLDGVRDVDTLAAVLAEATGIPKDDAVRDVTSLLDRLAEEGFLEETK
jgi:hypothetical protein